MLAKSLCVPAVAGRNAHGLPTSSSSTMTPSRVYKTRAKFWGIGATNTSQNLYGIFFPTSLRNVIKHDKLLVYPKKIKENMIQNH